MKKIIVINSFGPMASTLLAGLLEKMGCTNIPLRKIKLHQYLMGIEPLDSGTMQRRLIEILESHSTEQLSGGVSVLDRNNQKPKALTDFNLVRDRILEIVANSVEDLYFGCRNLYCDAVIYKKVETNRDWQIELTVDIHRYESEALYEAYKDQFEDVRMLHLHRPFDKWINSLASQTFLHPSIRERVMWFPHLRYADFARYEEAVAKMPGLHFDFDDWFDIPIEELAQTLSDFLDVPMPTVDLRNTDYDMYGKLRPYSIAFTKFDDKVVFLQPSTIEYIAGKAKAGLLGRPWYALFAWMLYLKDMSKYRRAAGKSWL